MKNFAESACLSPPGSQEEVGSAPAEMLGDQMAGSTDGLASVACSSCHC